MNNKIAVNIVNGRTITFSLFITKIFRKFNHALFKMEFECCVAHSPSRQC